MGRKQKLPHPSSVKGGPALEISRAGSGGDPEPCWASRPLVGKVSTRSGKKDMRNLPVSLIPIIRPTLFKENISKKCIEKKQKKNKSFSKRVDRLSESKNGRCHAPSGKVSLSRKNPNANQVLAKRVEKFKFTKLVIPQELRGSLNPSKIKTLSVSLNSIRGGYSPYYRFRNIFKDFKRCRLHIQQKIQCLLDNALIFTKIPVGIPLTENIRLVRGPTLKICDFILSRVPFWGSSYTKSVILDIVCLLKGSHRRGTKAY
jgi:hypothetical protein